MLANFAPTSDVEHCLCTRGPSPVNMYAGYYLKVTQAFNIKVMTTRCMSTTNKIKLVWARTETILKRFNHNTMMIKSKHIVYSVLYTNAKTPYKYDLIFDNITKKCTLLDHRSNYFASLLITRKITR